MTAAPSVAVCDYGAGNIRSVIVALRRLGSEVTVTADPGTILRERLAVLPGVGSARSAMTALRERGIDQALRERTATGRRTLGICLGLQLAMEWSDEDGGVECLGILPGRMTRIAAERVPRMGWARVEPWGEAYYFAHSYAAETSAVLAVSEGLTAAAGNEVFTGLQFHPEKSGPAGGRLLRHWLIDDLRVTV
ncbi:MAG: imidazole glycerol phosphate synthase subunit HisH [Acidimicrobiales bacterium]